MVLKGEPHWRVFGIQQFEAQAFVERLPFGTGVKIDIRQIEFPCFLYQALHHSSRQPLVSELWPGENIDDPPKLTIRCHWLPHHFHYLQESSCGKDFTFQCDAGKQVAIKMLCEERFELMGCLWQIVRAYRITKRL